MSKPTIFFSHSSKDKDAILTIKNKLDSATGGVLEIFMSSDGQSIPFGTNWIHKIEEGLQAAKIMFVFVTEVSVASGWIYFEAGFAYSKGIQVVPVGIGIDIGTLKAPLNLLQGFNIASEDSLNNFITIINRTFDYHFKEAFDKNDYTEVMNLASLNTNKEIGFEKIVRQTECSIYSEQTSNGEKIEYDLEGCFNKIIEYLDRNSINYSQDSKYHGSESRICLMVYGIKIVYYKAQKRDPNVRYSSDELGEIKFQLSPYNFAKSFNLLKELLLLIEDKSTHYLRVYLQDGYGYVDSDENIASVISNATGFNFDKTYIGGYIYNELDLKFYIFEEQRNARDHKTDRLMSIVYKCDTVCANHITNLLYRLCDIGLICEKN